ncbi:hypothetical protein Tco_0820386 [Tanacetum coccineum]|uniref:Uncharacterized protein n=1 Tax=Tanacetum coccineum TaxID=301880 RepID=A0ABQ5ACC5_9ASTR
MDYPSLLHSSHDKPLFPSRLENRRGRRNTSQKTLKKEQLLTFVQRSGEIYVVELMMQLLNLQVQKELLAADVHRGTLLTMTRFKNRKQAMQIYSNRALKSNEYNCSNPAGVIWCSIFLTLTVTLQQQGYSGHAVRVEGNYISGAGVCGLWTKLPDDEIVDPRSLEGCKTFWSSHFNLMTWKILEQPKDEWIVSTEAVYPIRATLREPILLSSSPFAPQYCRDDFVAGM